jgi:cytochrome oxidase Cu insertion factor (SCO1/SenC/PrrC family)
VKLLRRRSLLAFAACAALPVHAADAQRWHGRVPPADVGGELNLTDQRGQRFALQRVAGRPVLVFFGFTHCGSTCPIALATAREVLHASAPGQVPAVVFVTLDPLTDGPEQMRSFVERIDGAARVRRVYPHTTPAAALMADIRRLQALAG